MSNKHSIQGKVVLITGGAKNVGGLLARDFAQHGAKAVAIHYNSAANKAAADETVAAIKAAGAQAVALQGDLTTAAAMEKLFADTIAAVGRPDIAINTVGKVLKKPMTDISFFATHPAPPIAVLLGWELIVENPAAGTIEIVSSLHPISSAQPAASSRLAWLVKRLGIITHHTRSGPSASAAIAAQIAESIPPDSPSTTPGKRLRST